MKCIHCNGEGRVGSGEENDQAPWSFWASLPPGSDFAVRLGFVYPVDCPRCDGTGTVAVSA